MVYESSYESGRKPFYPDTTRGYWAQPTDFIFLCLGLALKLDFAFEPMSFVIRMGIYSFIPYLICCALYIVPIMVIHAFMGQFSSSGFISAFRVSPLFKGMGYISLALNFAILTYYSVFATIPLLFFFNSLKPTLPWSCEAFPPHERYLNYSKSVEVSICNASDANLIKQKYGIDNETRLWYKLPSNLFFGSHFSSFGYEEEEENFKLSFSWELFACTILTWGIIAGLFYKFFDTPNLGKILRYGIFTVLGLLVICLIRFMFLPGALNSLDHYIIPDIDDLFKGMPNVLAYSILAFGPGWGSIISLSSFNKFDRNIMRDSWIICLGQMLIFMAFNLSGILVQWHFKEITNGEYYHYLESHWQIYLSSGSAFANMSFGNLWSLLYYGMLTLAALIVIVTQIFSLLITVFDEFENLRPYKFQTTFILIGILSLFSLYLCTNEGIMFFSALSADTLFTQTALNLLLLLVILWIYGRERFQRDIEFMLKQPFSTWKVNMLRFVSPLCLILILLITIVNLVYEHFYSTTFMTIAGIFFILLPWISIPAYGLFITIQTTGPWMSRFKRSCRPTDWYPVAQEDRQRYEEAMGNENITHQLNEFGDEVL